MRKVAVATLVFVCLGCDSTHDIGPDPDVSGEPSDVGNQSGTRLKRRLVKTMDGGIQFVGWFDTERQENCDVRTGPDGVDRCMPSDLISDRLGLFSSDLVVYTEPSCTNAVYVGRVPRRGQCDEPLKYIFQSPESLENCPADYYYVYKIGEATSISAAGSLYVKRESGCHLFNPQATDYVYAATEIPANAFVEAESVIE